MKFLLKTAAAVALSTAMSAAFAVTPDAHPAAAEVAVSRGADYVSPPAIPQQFFLDARTRPVAQAWQPGDLIREVPRQFHGEEDLQANTPEPLNPVWQRFDLLVELQREVRAPLGSDAFTTPLVNRDAQAFSGVYPPDPSGDVGGGYYVQAINDGVVGATYVIYNSNDGSVAAGPLSMQSLGSGGACANGFGDGIVVFDQLARRWLLTEFSGSGNNLCVYISSTDNPVATTWTRYAFTTPNFPDYPKYGVWPDAYYVGANENSPSLIALDRAKMLLGQPATLQRKTVSRLSGLSFQMLLPASANGTTAPPTGAPGIFVRPNDDERTRPGSNDPNKDFIELFAYAVDWTNPANTSVTGPVSIAQAEFDSRFTVSGFGAIQQPGTTRKLDPLLEVLMYSFHYRNFGDHESLVGNHVTQIQTGNIAGIRWFELRRTGGANGTWSMHQQGTYAPTDAGGQISRWMGASAMDQEGNIALAYSVARATPAVYPGLRYTGRQANDPLDVMTMAESSIVEGASSQTSFDRWGDYHQMGVDPDDGCTFWFTGMYQPTGGRWTTRIASFRFDGCGSTEANFTLQASNLDQSVCAATATPVNLQPVTLTITPSNGFADPVTMSFAAPGLPTGFAGDFTLNPVVPPALSTDATLAVSNAAGAGPRSVILRGSANGVDRDVTLAVDVVTQIPSQIALVAPVDNATGQPAQPVFSWLASQQVENYRIEIATDAAFSNTIVAQTLPGGSTSFQPSAALPEGTQLYWRVNAINLCGTTPLATVFTFKTLGVPAVEVTPTSIAASALTGQSTTASIAIGNAGSADLNWTANTASADCASPGAVSWLSLSPTSGAIQAGASAASVRVDLDASGLRVGVHEAVVCMRSNDSTRAVIPVAVTFTVALDPDDAIFIDGFDGP